jgi:hypothetical protein
MSLEPVMDGPSQLVSLMSLEPVMDGLNNSPAGG